MRIRVRGKAYILKFVKDLHHENEKVKGVCDKPTKKYPRKIQIDKDLKGEEKLEVICHEILHACFWDLDEEAIDDAGKVLAEILYKLGYRNKNE